MTDIWGKVQEACKNNLPSLVISSVIMAGLLIWLWRRQSRGVEIHGPILADPIGLHLASGKGRDFGTLLVAIVWLLLSAVMTFVVPIAKGAYLLEPVQAITALNFCLAVPLLVGCYVALLRGHARLFGGDEDDQGVKPVRHGGFWVAQIVVVVAAVTIQSRAAQSEVDLPTPCSPWVHVEKPSPKDPNVWVREDARADEKGRLVCHDWVEPKTDKQPETPRTFTLSPGPDGGLVLKSAAPPEPPPVQTTDKGSAAASAVPPHAKWMEPEGNLYYVLRGLDTLLALGLFGTLLTIGWTSGRGNIARRLDHLKRTLTVIDYRGLRPTDAVMNFGTALLFAIMLGSIITALQGIALFAHGSHHGGRYQMRLITESTWLLWVVLTLVGSLLAASTVLNLRDCIVAEIAKWYRKELAAMGVPQSAGLAAPGTSTPSADPAKFAADAAAREAIAQKYRAAPTWPLPAGALPAIGFATLAQVGNVVLALYGFAAAGPPG